MTCMLTRAAVAVAVSLIGANAWAEAPIAAAPISRAQRSTRWSDYSLYVAPDSDAAAHAATLRAAGGGLARALSLIAAHPQAKWLGDWNADPRAVVDAVMDAAGDALPVFVMYNIPQRDCGNWSAGGAPSATAYRSFVDAVADGLDGREAIVVLEPDALALTWCLTPAALAERHQLLSGAVDTLAGAGAGVYIDAGDSRWIGAETMAAALRAAGVARAEGFALNVSHTERTADERAYAEALRDILGDSAHYVIDTSRNGRGPTADHAWCNPRGRALGSLPTVKNVDGGLDALLWIKPPGDSDGSCNGGPPAGVFWPEYAQELVELAGY